MTSGTSVLSCVDWFAPARHSGASGLGILRELAPLPPSTSRPRFSGRPDVISIHLPPLYSGPSEPLTYLPPTSAAALPPGLAGRPPWARIVALIATAARPAAISFPVIALS